MANFFISTFTLLAKHRKTQYIFAATVHFFHSHFTTYDLLRFATKQTGPKSQRQRWEMRFTQPQARISKGCSIIHYFKFNIQILIFHCYSDILDESSHFPLVYIFSATVHFFHSHFTTYDLRRFAKQTGHIKLTLQLQPRFYVFRQILLL